jgi:hypothetical protein
MKIPCQFQVSQGGEELVDCGVKSIHFYKTESPFLSIKPYNLYCFCEFHKPTDGMMPEGTWEEDRITEEEFVILQVMDE